jgi:hypothetical protein
MMNKRDYATGAVLAGALLVALPLLDFALGGESAAAVRAVVGTCGLGLLALWAGLKAVKEGT